jgi:hypothetical protein
MTPIARDAPASIACDRSGLPLLAACASGHRRLVPFRLLRTSAEDRTMLYGRPFLCRTCGSRDVALWLVDDQAELEALLAELSPPASAAAPTNRRRSDPAADLP